MFGVWMCGLRKLYRNTNVLHRHEADHLEKDRKKRTGFKNLKCYDPKAYFYSSSLQM